MRIVMAPPTERTEVKTLGDVRIRIVERGNRVVSLEINQAGRVPTLDRFSSEVRERAERWWFSTARERRILNEAGKQGRLNYEIVKQALLRDRAAAIELRMQRKDEKVRVKRQRRLFKLPAHRRQLFARGGTALSVPTAALPQNVLDVLRGIKGVTLPEPERSERGRGR
jgi:hypothetical protein